MTENSKPPELPGYFHENDALTKAEIDRKIRSEQKLHREGVRINPHLPCIECASELKLRDPQDVYRRFVALILVSTCAADHAIGNPEGDIDELIGDLTDKLDASGWFTEREKRYLDSRGSNPSESLQLSWRYEAALPLYWSLGEGDAQLDRPIGQCDVSALTLAARDNRELANRSLRDIDAILDEADLIFRYHWAVRQATLDGEDTGGSLDASVVMERHHALNWLIGRYDEDWEDVSTDT